MFANAWAKRLSKSTVEAPGTATIEDTAVTDLTRVTRSMGEQLHDETRALIRRMHTEVCSRFDEIDRRMDQQDRARRDAMAEFRRTMKPPSFEGVVGQLDQID